MAVTCLCAAAFAQNAAPQFDTPAFKRGVTLRPADDPAPIVMPGPGAAVSETEFYGSAALAQAARLCADGKQEEGAALYLKLTDSADKNEAFLALKNLAFTQYFNGEIRAAQDTFAKAAALRPNDPVVGLFRGWAWLSLGKNRQAVEAFARAVSLADAPAVTADARIGEALAFYLDGKYDEADKKLKAIYSTDPYTISFSAYLLGMLNMEKGEYPSAEIYFEQSLKHDSMNFSSARELYSLYSKTGDYLRTWQTYATIAQLEPDNPEIGTTLAKLAKHLDDKADRFSPRVRASGPINGYFRYTPSAQVNAALYADNGGTPARLTKAAFIAASSFSVCDPATGPISRGKRGDEWTMQFNPVTREVSVLNNWGNVEYLSDRPFRLHPETQGAGILIKNAAAPGPLGSMLDDKELRGEITVIPDATGFFLVNNTTVEDFLPGVMMPLRFGAREPEALKALAVAVRTQLTAAVRVSSNPWYNFCDSKACLRYGGINTEIQAVVEAADQTRGETLAISSAAGAFEACGGMTAYGARDSEKFTDLPLSPAQRAERILALPPGDLMCAPRWSTEWAADKWTVMFDADTVNKRFKRLYHTRPVVKTAPAGWDRRGALTGVETASRDKNFKLPPDSFSQLLAAGTLRSDFYYIIPIYDGSAVQRFLVRGIGTGHGHGLCVKGAQKAAEAGYGYREILKHYFPEEQNSGETR